MSLERPFGDGELIGGTDTGRTTAQAAAHHRREHPETSPHRLPDQLFQGARSSTDRRGTGSVRMCRKPGLRRARRTPPRGAAPESRPRGCPRGGVYPGTPGEEGSPRPGRHAARLSAAARGRKARRYDDSDRRTAAAGRPGPRQHRSAGRTERLRRRAGQRLLPALGADLGRRAAEPQAALLRRTPHARRAGVRRRVGGRVRRGRLLVAAGGRRVPGRGLRPARAGRPRSGAPAGVPRPPGQ